MTEQIREYIIHVTENCVFCKQAKALLEYYGCKYELVYEKSPDWETFPCIYLKTNSDSILIGGFNELAAYSYENGL